MLLPFLIAKIHGATVTGADLNYSGSILIDEDFLEKTNLREFQKVDVYNVTNGNRLSTYIIKGDRGSKEIVINGAAAHQFSTGDKIIIAAYVNVDEKELDSLNPVILIMGDNNSVEKTIYGKI